MRKKFLYSKLIQFGWTIPQIKELDKARETVGYPSLFQED